MRITRLGQLNQEKPAVLVSDTEAVFVDDLISDFNRVELDLVGLGSLGDRFAEKLAFNFLLDVLSVAGFDDGSRSFAWAITGNTGHFLEPLGGGIPFFFYAISWKFDSETDDTIWLIIQSDIHDKRGRKAHSFPGGNRYPTKTTNILTPWSVENIPTELKNHFTYGLLRFFIRSTVMTRRSETDKMEAAKQIREWLDGL